MAKQMLVSYLDRKKVFLIPGSVVNELQFLREKFEKEFKFDHQSNVNLDINFQKYNKEWDEYVDLDDGCILGQREKLKAVVTPILVSGSSQVRLVVCLMCSINPPPQSYMCPIGRLHSILGGINYPVHMAHGQPCN